MFPQLTLNNQQKHKWRATAQVFSKVQYSQHLQETSSDADFVSVVLKNYNQLYGRHFEVPICKDVQIHFSAKTNGTPTYFVWYSQCGALCITIKIKNGKRKK